MNMLIAVGTSCWIKLQLQFDRRQSDVRQTAWDRAQHMHVLTQGRVPRGDGADHGKQRAGDFLRNGSP